MSLARGSGASSAQGRDRAPAACPGLSAALPGLGKCLMAAAVSCTTAWQRAAALGVSSLQALQLLFAGGEMLTELLECSLRRHRGCCDPACTHRTLLRTQHKPSDSNLQHCLHFQCWEPLWGEKQGQIKLQISQIKKEYHFMTDLLLTVYQGFKSTLERLRAES